MQPGKASGAPFGRARKWLMILVVGLSASSCGIINPDEGAEDARVEVSGDDSSSLDLVTSLDFTIFVQPESNQQTVDLNSADTVSLNALPFDQTYDISSNDRFFVRLSNPDTLTQPTVSMKVTVDGRVLYNSSGDIGGETLLEFLYRLGRS